MITVKIPYDKGFELDKCKEMYEKNVALLNEDASFEHVVKNTWFYSFYDDEKLLGCIYLFKKNSGFADGMKFRIARFEVATATAKATTKSSVEQIQDKS